MSNLRKTSSSVIALPPLPPLPTISQESLAKQKDLYAAVGRALTSWAGVEDALCRVLCTILNPRVSHPTERAYWAIASFDGRLKMTDRAVEERLQIYQDKFALWTDLKPRLDTLNTLRNKIAHGTVVLTAKSRRYPEGRWVLAPYYHSRKGPEFLEQLRKGRRKFTFEPNPKEKMGEKEVYKQDLAFFLLQMDLEKFVFSVEPRVRIEEELLRVNDPRPPVYGGLLGPAQ